MKRLTVRYQLLWLSTLAVVLMAGCPGDLLGIDRLADLAGTYWVEYESGQLRLFELPEHRGEAGLWYNLPADPPEWFVGPGLYEIEPGGTGTPLLTDPSLTLDEVMQVYDPRPEVD